MDAPTNVNGEYAYSASRRRRRWLATARRRTARTSRSTGTESTPPAPESGRATRAESAESTTHLKVDADTGGCECPVVTHLARSHDPIAFLKGIERDGCYLGHLGIRAQFEHE